jgi:hypothetical protein
MKNKLLLVYQGATRQYHMFKTLDLPCCTFSPPFSKASFTFCMLLVEISEFKSNL